MQKHYLILLCFFPTLLFSQNMGPWEIGGGVHLTSYEGDLHAPDINYLMKDAMVAFSGHVRRKAGNNVALRFNLLAGQIAGADKSFTDPAWRQIRAASFKSPIVEGTLIAECYPFGLVDEERIMIKKGSGRPGHFSPFVAIGIGGAYSKPTVNWNDANGNPEIDPALAQMDKNAKTKQVHFVLPFGGGLRYSASKRLNIYLEGMLRPTFSDYLDGFSQAGNSNKKDWFFTVGIGIGYTIGAPQPFYDNPSVH